MSKSPAPSTPNNKLATDLNYSMTTTKCVRHCMSRKGRPRLQNLNEGKSPRTDNSGDSSFQGDIINQSARLIKSKLHDTNNNSNN